MIDTVVIQPEAAAGEPSIAGVSWPAVTAGAIVSCALTLVLIAFGVGLGLSVVSPWAGVGCLGHHLQDRYRTLSDRDCDALLVDWRLHRRAAADTLGRRAQR